MICTHGEINLYEDKVPPIPFLHILMPLHTQVNYLAQQNGKVRDSLYTVNLSNITNDLCLNIR